MADLVITGSRVVTTEGAGPAVVVVEDGRVASLEAPGATPAARRRVDAGDAVVMPGIVDVHVHVNDPGHAEWEGFETAGSAAAAGGTTTLVDMPLNSLPVTTSVEALEAKRAAARDRCTVDYLFWGGIVPGNAAEIEPLLAAGVPGFKCFLVPSGLEEFPPVNADDLREVMPILAERGVPLLVHAEDPTPLAAARAAPPDADPRSYAAYLASRPPAAEEEAIALLLNLAREFRCSVHVVHLSAATALKRLRTAREEGVPVTVETCPHYLTFAAEDIPDGATVFKCAPPIRERANRERLWDGLREGVIDLVASDHSPCPPEMKHGDSGDFQKAWGGIASLQFLLSAVWTQARERAYDVEALARWLCQRPAGLAGVAGRKGKIAPGYDADIVIWNPEATFAVDESGIRHRHPPTPYAGMTLAGAVERTFVRGVEVFSRETGVIDRPAGRDLGAGR